MTVELLEYCKQKYEKSVALREATGGRFRIGQALDDELTPYVVAWPISETPEHWAFTTNGAREGRLIRLQFDIYTDRRIYPGPEKALIVADLVEQTFDWREAVSRGFEIATFERSQRRQIREDEMWRVTFDYLIHAWARYPATVN